MVNSKVFGRMALTAIAVGLLAAPIAAKSKSISCSFSLNCSGVNELGSLSSSLGSKCTTKCYKDSKTGICTYTAKCSVWNKCGKLCDFFNQGLPCIDPVSRKSLTCTSDSQSVSKPSWNSRKKCWNKSSCTLSGCYNPCDTGDSYEDE